MLIVGTQGNNNPATVGEPVGEVVIIVTCGEGEAEDRYVYSLPLRGQEGLTREELKEQIDRDLYRAVLVKVTEIRDRLRDCREGRQPGWHATSQ